MALLLPKKRIQCACCVKFLPTGTPTGINWARSLGHWFTNSSQKTDLNQRFDALVQNGLVFRVSLDCAWSGARCSSLQLSVWQCMHLPHDMDKMHKRTMAIVQWWHNLPHLMHHQWHVSFIGDQWQLSVPLVWAWKCHGRRHCAFLWTHQN